MSERRIICECGCVIQEGTPVRLGGLMLPAVRGECQDCREAREADEREDAEARESDLTNRNKMESK